MDDIIGTHLDDIDRQLAKNPGDALGDGFNAAWYLYLIGDYTLDDYLYSLVHFRHQEQAMETSNAA